MQAVLIYKDTEQIAKENKYLIKVVNYLQHIYDQLKAISVDVSLTELITLGTYGSNSSRESKANSVREFVSDYFLQKAGEPDFNGVKISRAKLKDMLDMPDLSGVLQGIYAYEQWRESGFGLDKALLKLENNVISEIDNKQAILDIRYTYYTKNDAGVLLVNILFDLCTALNEYHLVEGSFSGSGHVPSLPILGIEFKDGSFRPELHYVRQREELRSSFVAV